MIIMKKSARVELFIGGPDTEINKQRFDFFAARRKEIEKIFGEPLIWDFKEGRKQHYIRTNINIGGLDDEKIWDKIQEEMIDKLVRLKKALGPFIKELS